MHFTQDIQPKKTQNWLINYSGISFIDYQRMSLCVVNLKNCFLQKSMKS